MVFYNTEFNIVLFLQDIVPFLELSSFQINFRNETDNFVLETELFRTFYIEIAEKIVDFIYTSILKSLLQYVHLLGQIYYGSIICTTYNPAISFLSVAKIPINVEIDVCHSRNILKLENQIIQY